jgi:hypothetical protein
MRLMDCACGMVCVWALLGCTAAKPAVPWYLCRMMTTQSGPLLLCKPIEEPTLTPGPPPKSDRPEA